MTDDEREEVQKIALSKCESRGDGCLTFFLIVALCGIIAWNLGDAFVDIRRAVARITALEAQVKELKEAKPKEAKP